MHINVLRAFVLLFLLINSIFFLPYETLSGWSKATMGVGVHTSTDVTLLAMLLTMLTIGAFAISGLLWVLFLKPFIHHLAARR